MIKKIVSQRGHEFALGQYVELLGTSVSPTSIEYIRGEEGDYNSEYVVTLDNGDWVAVRNPGEVWYGPDPVAPAEG